MAKKWSVPDTRNLMGRQVYALRMKWSIDAPTLAGRADVGTKMLQKYEAGHLKNVPADFRSSVNKALRQMIVERAAETLRVYEAAIAADPDAHEYTREAAARRRRERYQSWSTTNMVAPDITDDA